MYDHLNFLCLDNKNTHSSELCYLAHRWHLSSSCRVLPSNFFLTHMMMMMIVKTMASLRASASKHQYLLPTSQLSELSGYCYTILSTMLSHAGRTTTKKERKNERTKEKKERTSSRLEVFATFEEIGCISVRRKCS